MSGSRANKQARRHYGAPLGPAKKSTGPRRKPKEATAEERAAAIRAAEERARKADQRSRSRQRAEDTKPSPRQTERVTPEGTSVVDALRRRDEYTRAAMERAETGQPPGP